MLQHVHVSRVKKYIYNLCAAPLIRSHYTQRQPLSLASHLVASSLSVSQHFSLGLAHLTTGNAKYDHTINHKQRILKERSLIAHYRRTFYNCGDEEAVMN